MREVDGRKYAAAVKGEYSKVRKEILTGAIMQQPSKVAKGVRQGEERSY
jgi:hypothetical protein